MSKGYEDEQRTLQAEADIIQNELQKEEKKSVDVKRFLAVVKKYTDLTELTPEILHDLWIGLSSMLLIRAAADGYRKLRSSTIISENLTVQRSLSGKEMRYSISNAIPHNPKSKKHPYENLVKKD